MEEEEEDSDKGIEDEENSDDAQAEIDRKVAQMLQNQQQYIQMCSSSAQILQLLSRLVPGVAMSGQVMKLESVTDDSENSTPRSASESSAHSPATSDDNSGCVLWAEPIMTCQLVPSWKPYCNDVRRLPPGVKPEDLKSKKLSRSAVFSNNGPPSGAAGSRYSGNWKDGAPQHSRTNAGSRNTSTQTPRKEDGSNPPVVNDHVTTRAAFSEALMRISSAADTIKRAKNILAAVNTCHQANNNNNPEISFGEGSSKEPETAKSEQRKSDKDIGGSSHDTTENGVNVAVEAASVAEQVQSTSSKELQLHNENSSYTTFPVPILVKEAADRSETAHISSAKIKDANNTGNELSASTSNSDRNMRPSNSSISGFCDRTPNADGLPKQSTTNRKVSLSSRHVKTDRATWDTRTKPTEFQPTRIVRQSHVNGQLYRNPYNNAMLQSNNRTQQTVSIGGIQDNNSLPPLENLPGTLSRKTPISEKYSLDIGTLVIPQKSLKPQCIYRITLAHLKNALEIAINNLKKLDTVTVSEKIISTDVSPKTRSTVSAFTLTEVESLNIPPDYAERDSPSSETVHAILSDIICEATTVAEIITSGNNTRSIADSATEVENIEDRSLKNQPVEAGSHCGLSRNKVKAVNNVHHVTCSNLQHTDMMACQISPSYKKDSNGSRGENQIQRASSFSQQCYNRASSDRTVYSKNISSDDTQSKSDSRSREGAMFYETPRKNTTEVNGSIKDEEIRKEDNLDDSISVVSPNAVSETRNTIDDTQRTQISHLSIMKSVACDFRPHVRRDVRRVKSALEYDLVQKHNDSSRPWRPPSAVDRPKLEGDGHVDVVIATKGGDDFPPTNPEAGDTVESLTKYGEIMRSPINSNNQDMVRNVMEEDVKVHTPSGGSNILHNLVTIMEVPETIRKKKGTLTNGKSAWEDADKRLTNITTEQVTKASLHKEINKPIKVAEGNAIRNCASTQLEDQEDQALKASTAIGDYVVEINIMQEEQTPERNDDFTEKCVLKSHQEDHIHDQPHSLNFTNKSQGSSASCSHHNDSKHSSQKGTPLSKHSKEVLLVNNNEVSPHMKYVPRQKKACGISCSRSFGMRFRRRSKNRPIGQHKTDIKTKWKCSSNMLISSSSRTHFVDMSPGHLPGDNLSVRTFSPGTCIKSTVVLQEVRDTPPIISEYSPQVHLNGVLAIETEQMIDDPAKTLTHSALAGKESPISSRSSSIDISGATRDGGLVPTPASSLIAITTETPPLINEDTRRGSNGFKVRLRRFFAQCLHPFVNRN